MNNQGVTYAELNLPKKSKGRQVKPKGTKISEPQQEITYADLKLRNVSQDLPGKDKRNHCKGLAAPPEKLIAGILGLTCLVLIGTIVTLWVISITGTQKNNSSLTTQKANLPANSSLECHYGTCPKDSFTYSKSCYFSSNEKKTWNESVKACASKKSHLLYIDHEKEMEFLKSMELLSWVGVSRESSNQPWKAINGSVFKQNVTDLSTGINNNCIMLTSSGLRADLCEYRSVYYCKQRL
ncbi:NKG2-A/NKG2-B type II integral membrane protein-like [Talpa occidentalis]|uniref:NKG2-A/NKG2-B type II integral membrane protein-like n=1 Tax=Talpa occidentalis TaxID=50954 RepID=UPI00188F947E|nr:NKG2-A/NKG2-B type II integral membrane protein-like [Talpa occidentalis]